MTLLNGFKWLTGQLFIEAVTLYGGDGKDGGGDAPDFSAVAAATEKAAQYAKESADADLAFRKEQYQQSLPYQKQLYDLASQVAQQQLGLGNLTEQQAKQQLDSYNATYRPIELQTVLDSLGTQYLSDEDVQQAIKYLTDPKYDVKDIMGKRTVTDYVDVPWEEVTTTESKTQAEPTRGGGYMGMADYAIGLLGGNRAAPASTTKSTTTKKGVKQEARSRQEDYVAGQDKTLNKQFEQERAAFIDSLAKKAQENAALRASEGTQAQVNSAVGQQSRQLARMGLNTGRMQANMAATAQTQALQNVNAQNQTRQQVAAQQAALRTGVANFGRNMPNTAGQAVGLSTNAGSSAVGNQNTGFMSGLAYPQYVSGGVGNQLQAAQIRQQGALGLGGLQNQAYAASMNQDNFLGGALGLAGSLGSAAILKSDVRTKDNIHFIGYAANGIKLYSFTYKPEFQTTYGSHMHIGVLAHEVEEVVPHAVSVGADGYKQVDYRIALGV